MKREDKYIRLDQESLIKDIIENIKLNKNKEASLLIKKYNIPIDRLFKKINNINLLKEYYPLEEHKKIHEISLTRIKFENKEVFVMIQQLTFVTVLSSSLLFYVSNNRFDKIPFGALFLLVGIPLFITLCMLISWSKNKRKIKKYQHKLLDK